MNTAAKGLSEICDRILMCFRCFAPPLQDDEGDKTNDEFGVNFSSTDNVGFFGEMW